MEVFSLSGSSGTGKSTSALSFAHLKKIPAIIDDGLLIVNGHKVAGTSAKFEKSTIAAVKRATFFDEEHAKEVQAALKNYFIGKILIIGTSDKMTKLIASRLQLGEINHLHYIEDVRTTSEIKVAQYVRRMEGKHIIPIPYKQVEQNFFKKLVQKGKDIFSPKSERIGETTIVHPDFHRGAVHIDKNVFKDIIEYTCLLNRHISHCNSVHFRLEGLPSARVEVGLVYPVAYNLIEVMEKLQTDIQNRFIDQLNIELDAIHIQIAPTVKKKESLMAKQT